MGYAAENIDPENDDSQLAYGENIGWLNAEPWGDGGPGVEVTNAELTGYIWSENIGWINLSPLNYGGVLNDGAGNLSGYAWGENIGWINFAPSGGGVVIDVSTGIFSGKAWGENIGWIDFQNLSVPYHVQTEWAPPPSAILGDLDGDGDVDVTDLSIFRSSLGACSTAPNFIADADYDGDGCVSYADYRTWYGYYTDYVG